MQILLINEAKERLQMELVQVERIIKDAIPGTTRSRHAEIRREIIVYQLEQPDEEIVSFISPDNY